MDRAEIRQKLTELVRKYRMAVLVLLVGLMMMCFPERQAAEKQMSVPEQQDVSLQQELENLLSKLEGAGQVRVLLSICAGEKRHYQMDTDLSETADTLDRRTEAVIITSSDRQEQGLLQWIDPPIYSGAVILSQGADSASVRLSLVEAVRAATGLGADRIAVLKMK